MLEMYTTVCSYLCTVYVEWLIWNADYKSGENIKVNRKLMG